MDAAAAADGNGEAVKFKKNFNFTFLNNFLKKFANKRNEIEREIDKLNERQRFKTGAFAFLV